LRREVKIADRMPPLVFSVRHRRKARLRVESTAYKPTVKQNTNTWGGLAAERQASSAECSSLSTSVLVHIPLALSMRVKVPRHGALHSDQPTRRLRSHLRYCQEDRLSHETSGSHQPNC
jgi:hypothetical protein